jgi:hypothetical protein
MKSITEQIEDRIGEHDSERCFPLDDFMDLAGRDALDPSLRAALSEDQKIEILVGFAEGILAETESLDREIAAIVSEHIWDLI